jgi:hypothetical protein
MAQGSWLVGREYKCWFYQRSNCDSRSQGFVSVRNQWSSPLHPASSCLLRHQWLRHFTQQWQTPNCGLPATNLRSTETPVAQTLHTAVADAKLRPSSHQLTVYWDTSGSDTTHSSGRRQTAAFQPPTYGLLRHQWLRHYTQQWQTPYCGLPATNLQFQILISFPDWFQLSPPVFRQMSAS